MADQITTFIQATGKTLSELSAGVPIVVNTVGQTAVIKEVEIQTTGVPVGTEFYLDSSGWQLGDKLTTESAETAADLTYQEGYEYIGESQTYSLKTHAAGVFNGFQSAANSTQIRTYAFTPNSNDIGGTAFTGQYVRAGVGSNVFTQGAADYTQTVGTAMSVVPNLYFYHDGDFYYAVEGNGTLYKRAGGIDGTQTTITGHGGLCWAFDGRYVYTMTNSTQNYTQYDLQTSAFIRTAVTTNVGNTVQSSYCAGQAIDGFYFVRARYSSYIYIIDSSDNSSWYVTGGNVNSTSYGKSMFGVAKHTNGDYICCFRVTNYACPQIQNLGPDLANPVNTAMAKANGGATALTNYSAIMSGATGANNIRPIPYDAFYTVTVVNSGSGNKFAINGVEQETLNLYEGATYKFDQSSSTNAGHPLRFSTTANGTHGGGSEYTTGVTTNGTAGSAGAYTQIVVATGAATLYYYCSAHSGMGGTANTPVRQNQFFISGANQVAWIVDFTDVVPGFNGYTYATAIQYFKTSGGITTGGWNTYCMYGQPINITNANSAFGTVALRSTGVKTT
jgi:hypothetical protein